MHKLIFRFDIDTHKCIRDGVPNLVKIAHANNVSFTFFLNLGKAVSVKESIKSILSSQCNEAAMMSAREKLGNIDYLYAALVNPPLFHYKKQILYLLKSNCEIGIHGGKNHALWGKQAEEWNGKKIKAEIDWSISKIKSIDSSYQPCGFTSPEWMTPKNLDEILLRCGFKYYTDRRCGNDASVVDRCGKIPNVGVNMVGEPGGVAFFESCRVKGMQTSEIISTVIAHVKKYPCTVLYDHPYYAGTKELDTIQAIIRQGKSENVEIVPLYSIV